MPRSGGEQAYSVSLLMNIVPIGQAGPRARPLVVEQRRTWVLLLCAVVLFAGCFALGRTLRSGHALPQAASATQALPADFTHAGIPYGLNPAAPIPSYSAFRANPIPHRSHHTAPAPSPAPAVSAPAESTPAATPAPTSPAPSSPAPAPVTPAPVHTPAPVVSQPRPAAPESGGGSFDTSE
jgi:hypothetical protein